MLEALIAQTETGEFEDSGALRFASIQQKPDRLQLELALIPGDDGDEQRWRIDCLGVLDFRLCGEIAHSLRLDSKHPSLLQYTEPVTDLYFASAAPNPQATVGALWERHRQLVGSWLPFEQFLNVLPQSLSILLASSSGHFASGPISLMHAYAEVLTEFGVRTSMLQARPPKYWDGEEWVAPPSRLHALVLDTSYVVAQEFTALRLMA